MRIAFVTPELLSLVRRTQLAEVSEALPTTLQQLGQDVRVFLPTSLDLHADALEGNTSAGKVTVADGGRRTTLRVETARLGDLPIVLLDHPELFGTRHPYGDQEGPYPDNWRRYAVFARAVLAAFEVLDFEPDVVHHMDWTTGLIPVIRQLEYVERDPDHPVSRSGTFFGIHNLAMQGSFEREILPKIGLPHAVFQHVHGVELAGKVNYLKAGAEYATILGTHSPGHALRIQETDRGYGLEETFQRRSKELVGIVNGVDYRTWDPTNDPLLPRGFSADDKDLAGKRKCKATLQANLGLNSGPRTPLIAVLGRFDADSGFDILAEVMVPILERNVQVVLMGAGRAEILERLRTMESTFEGRCKVIEGYDVGLAHLLLAAADALLMPSHFHSSNTLCAIGMRYGVVPLVYANSGLEDTVVDLGHHPKKGTGFSFESYTGDSLVEGLDALRLTYRDAAAWKRIVRRCLTEDFSWTATGEAYLKAYRRVTRRVPGRSRKNSAKKSSS